MPVGETSAPPAAWVIPPAASSVIAAPLPSACTFTAPSAMSPVVVSIRTDGAVTLAWTEMPLALNSDSAASVAKASTTESPRALIVAVAWLAMVVRPSCNVPVVMAARSAVASSSVPAGLPAVPICTA